MKIIWQSLLLFIFFTFLLGVFYPALIWAIAQSFFHEKSLGSLIMDGDKILGSKLIAQKYFDQKFFWPRPSHSDFNTLPSSASNFGPTNKMLFKSIEQRKRDLAKYEENENKIPMELLLTSASGLDPHISPKAAIWQATRVAKARNYSDEEYKKLIDLINNISKKQIFGFLGADLIYINELNFELEKLK